MNTITREDAAWLIKEARRISPNAPVLVANKYAEKIDELYNVDVAPLMDEITVALGKIFADARASVDVSKAKDDFNIDVTTTTLIISILSMLDTMLYIEQFVGSAKKQLHDVPSHQLDTIVLAVKSSEIKERLADLGTMYNETGSMLMGEIVGSFINHS